MRDMDGFLVGKIGLGLPEDDEMFRYSFQPEGPATVIVMEGELDGSVSLSPLTEASGKVPLNASVIIDMVRLTFIDVESVIAVIRLCAGLKNSERPVIRIVLQNQPLRVIQRKRLPAWMKEYGDLESALADVTS